MAGPRPSIVRFALLATALLGCGTEKKIQEFTAQYRQPIENNLAAWPAIAEQLRTLPPLAKSGIEGDHVLVVDALADASKSATASLCYAEDLADPDELGYVWGRMENTGALNHCASLLHRGHLAYDPAEPERALEPISMAESLRRFPRCGSYRYLLVLRTLEFARPTPASQATAPFLPIRETLDLDAPAVVPPPAPSKKRQRGKAKAAPAVAAEAAKPAGELLMPERVTDGKRLTRYLFEGGMLRAEVLLFELPSAKLLGGIRFAAQNSVQIDGTDDAIVLDLRYQAKTAMLQAMKMAIPGADFQGEGR